MTDSDFQILVDFRREVPAPNEATARRIYSLATAEQTLSRHSFALLRRSRRPRLMLAFTAAALVLVPSAIAFGGKVVDLFEGTPPPPAVSIAYATINRTADQAVREGFTAKFPHADMTKLAGVIEIQTADGPEDLWTAPNSQGGYCWFVDFPSDPASESGQSGNGTCDTATPPISKIMLGTFWALSHPSLSTVSGRVYVDAASVQLTLADGSTVTLPVVEGMFLGSLANTDKVERATAYDAGNSKVGEWTRP